MERNRYQIIAKHADVKAATHQLAQAYAVQIAFQFLGEPAKRTLGFHSWFASNTREPYVSIYKEKLQFFVNQDLMENLLSEGPSEIFFSYHKELVRNNRNSRGYKKKKWHLFRNILCNNEQIILEITSITSKKKKWIW